MLVAASYEHICSKQCDGCVVSSSYEHIDTNRTTCVCRAGEPLHGYGPAEIASRGRSSDGVAGGEGAAGFSGRTGPGLQYRPSAAADAGGDARAGLSLQPAQPKARAAAAAEQPALDPSWESWEQQQDQEQPGQQGGPGYNAAGGHQAA